VIKINRTIEFSENKHQKPFLVINLNGKKINILPIRKDKHKMNHFTLKIYKAGLDYENLGIPEELNQNWTIHIG